MGRKTYYGVETQRILLSEAFEALIDRTMQHGNPNTAANYRSALYKLNVYLAEECFTLQDVTSEWVKDFAAWLEEQHTGKLQTADFYFRFVRALYNKACREHHFDPPGGLNPFRNVSFKKSPVMKRAIVAEQVRQLTDQSFRERVPETLRECLDVLLFILYMRGMVFQDVYCLTWDMVTSDNHVRYLRNKTGIPIATEIPPEAREIMERHREANCSHVFPFLYRNKKEKTNGKPLCVKSALHRINQQARQIGRLAGLPIPLTTYVMRHTFATLMLEGGKSIEIISQCLGHTSIRTTLYYLSQISVAKVDKEVNEMFDHLLRPEKESEKERDIKTKTTRKKNRKRGKNNPPENVTDSNIIAINKKEKEPKKELLECTEEETERNPSNGESSFPCEKERQTTHFFPCEKEINPSKLLPYMALYGTKIKHLFYMAIILFHF